MSQSFRPVKEICNLHSSCFVEPEELIALLHDLAVRVGTASEEHEYGDNKAVWFEEGKKILDYRLHRSLDRRGGIGRSSTACDYHWVAQNFRN
jgi:hypothetical protein